MLSNILLNSNQKIEKITSKLKKKHENFDQTES